MGRSWCALWRLLGTAAAAAVVLALVRSCEGSPSHSLQYFYTGVSEPVQGLPQFIAVGYVDGQLFSQYDSNTREEVPKAPWINEIEKEDPYYSKRNTQNAQETELAFRESINILSSRYNRTGGLHTWQLVSGCELSRDGSKGGYYQDGYNGRDFIAFDKETLTWTAADAHAQVTKRKWDNNKGWTQHVKSYLEEECIEWLHKYLRYGSETLLRKEPPKMKVTSRTDYDNMETLICRADGFYPRDIEVLWTRDGKVWQEETHCGLVAPNSDGTYHTWISIKVDPIDKHRFHCRVDHASLEDPVHFAVEELSENWSFPLWVLVGCAALGIILITVVTGILLFMRKQQNGYKAALRSNKPIYVHP